MAPLINRFSTSFSRSRDIDKCGRQYFYRRFGHWNGWNSGAPKEAQLAYRLGKLTGAALVKGDLVHSVIERDMRSIKSVRGGTDYIVTEEYVQKEVKRRYAESVRNAVMKEARPKHLCTFSGHYYASQEEWVWSERELFEKTMAALENYFPSRFRKMLLAHPKRIVSIEEEENYQHQYKNMSIPVWVTMDLVVSTAKSPFLIADWKTGKRKEEHKEQLALYALYAHMVLDIPIADISVMNVYLDEGVDVYSATKDFTQANMDRAEAALNDNIEAQQAFLVNGDVKKNIPLPKGEFPVNKKNCRFCDYRELCGVEKGGPNEEDAW